MKISSSIVSSPPLANRVSGVQSQTKPESVQVPDSFESSSADSTSTFSTGLQSAGKHVARFAGNTLLAALPAAATTIAMSLGGPNAAGLALAGSILGGGAVSMLINGSEMGARQAFTVGGFSALLGAGVGMIAGPAGIGLSAGMGAIWSGTRQIAEATYS